MSENSRVVKAAGVVGAATLTSRILGFVRDAVIAWFFGAGFSSDAFIAAFRIPNLLRRLFAEGSLSSAFIPVFTEYIVKQGQPEAFNLARSAFRLLGGVLLVATICGVFLSPWVVRVIAPGFSADKLSLTIFLTRLMFPYIFFIGLVALCMGILNVLGHFAAPAFAPDRTRCRSPDRWLSPTGASTTGSDKNGVLFLGKGKNNPPWIETGG